MIRSQPILSVKLHTRANLPKVKFSGKGESVDNNRVLKEGHRCQQSLPCLISHWKIRGQFMSTTPVSHTTCSRILHLSTPIRPQSSTQRSTGQTSGIADVLEQLWTTLDVTNLAVEKIGSRSILESCMTSFVQSSVNITIFAVCLSRLEIGHSFRM